MIINANDLVQIQTATIKKESNNLIISQGGLRTQNSNLLNSHDAMMSYLSGDITSAYREIGEYVQAKMELLCSLIEGTANNSTSFATEAERIDQDADEKALKGEMRL